MAKEKNSAQNNGTSRRGFFATLGRWAKRMFFGASKELTMDEMLAVEKLESPSRLAVKAFFRRKLAVCALVVLVSLFLFVFIGPLVVPMNLNYTDPLQANIGPNYSFLKVPGDLENNIKNINGFADFTVGVSNDNDFYLICLHLCILLYNAGHDREAGAAPRGREDVHIVLCICHGRAGDKRGFFYCLLNSGNRGGRGFFSSVERSQSK
jgi:hypothetical protein